MIFSHSMFHFFINLFIYLTQIIFDRMLVLFRCFFDLTGETHSPKSTEPCCIKCDKPFSSNLPAIALECACIEYPSYHRDCIKDAIYETRVKYNTTDSCFACSLCNHEVNYKDLFEYVTCYLEFFMCDVNYLISCDICSINHTAESINKLIFGAEAYFRSEYERFTVQVFFDLDRYQPYIFSY